VFALPTAAQPVFSRDVAPLKGLGRTSLLIEALYWKYGDPKGIVSLAGVRPGYEGSSPPVLLNLALLRLIGHRQSLSVSANVGLTDTATDFSLGTTWRITGS
jgi:hypothetical protein